MKQFEISTRLHKINTVILIAHQDCGAYGGSKAFVSWDKEKARYVKDLNAAEKIIKEKFPQLQVEKIILTFNNNGNVAFVES